MSFSFGGAAPASTGASFGFGAAPASTSTFGAPAATAAPAASSFGFGAAAPAAGTAAAGAPATFGFGSAAPAATTAAAPAASTFGGFGFGTTAPAAQPTGFGFGSSAPAATTAAPASTGFGFGTFGAPAAQTAAATAAPAAAPAVQYPPHSIEARIAAIRAAYSPTSPECRFQTVFYNKVDSASVGNYVRPPHANPRLWESAVKNNPDPTSLVPSLAVGFDDLQRRVGEQTKAAAAFGASLDALAASLAAMLHGHEASTASALQQLQRVHAQQSHRLLQLVDRVECARARDVIPRLPEELQFEHKLHVLERALTQPQTGGGQGSGASLPLQHKIAQLAAAVKQLEARTAAGASGGDEGTSASLNASASWLLQDQAASEKLYHFLQTQRAALEHVTDIVKQDQRDLQTIQQVTQQANGGF